MRPDSVQGFSPEKDATVANRLEEAVKSLRGCEAALFEIYDKVLGPAGPMGISNSAAPVPPACIKTSSTDLLEGLTEMGNRLRRLSAAL